VRGNRFIVDGEPAKEVNYEVAFTGQSVFEGNFPEKFNGPQPGSRPADGGDAGATPEAAAAPEPATAPAPLSGDIHRAEAPLGGHGLRFSDGLVTPPGEPDKADILLHIDPLMANADAGIRGLGVGRLEDFRSAPASGYDRALWGAQAGDVLAIRTTDGRHALCEIVELSKERIVFRYRMVD